VVRLRLDLIHKTHRDVFEGLRAHGVGVNVHYIPVHTQPYYAHMGFAANDFPHAQQYYAEAISLPMYQDLTHAQQDYVVAALRKELCA
jgi:dTDP-4-amino-4,6-dideoxygalactose transaminase